MKLPLILVITICTINSFGQTSNKNLALRKPGNLADTTLKVIYIDKEKKSLEPAYFVNGELLNNVINSIDPKGIEKIDVLKENVEINGVKYYGKVFITLKKSYTFHSFSLSDLLKKYTTIVTPNNVFTINGNFINADPDNYFINENDLMRIIVDHIEDPKRNLSLNLIKILTKTKENIENLNKIRIRGGSEKE